jgi:hypothetical protein
MLSIINTMFHPVNALRKRMHTRRMAFVDAPPPPSNIDVEPCYGDYCIKATVEMTGREEKDGATFIGYSQNMDIGEKTKTVCERVKKGHQFTCGDPQISISGGECQEVLFMKLKKDGKLRQIFV